MSKGKVFENLTNKIQGFQRFQNFQRFRVFVLSYRAKAKRRKRRKIYKTWFQWQIKKPDPIFMGLNWWFRWKTSKKFHLKKEFFSRKYNAWLGVRVLGNQVFFCLCGIQILEISCMSYLGKSLRAWQRKLIVFKYLKFSGVSGFPFWAIEPIRKDGNDGKFIKLVSVAN